MSFSNGEPQPPKVYKKSSSVHHRELKARGFKCALRTIKLWLTMGMPEDEPARTDWILATRTKRPTATPGTKPATETATPSNQQNEVVAIYRPAEDLDYSRGRQVPDDPYERLVFWKADEAETKAAEAKVRLDKTKGKLIETKVVYGLMRRYTSTAIQVLSGVAAEVGSQFPDQDLQPRIERAIRDRVNGAANAIAKLMEDIVSEFNQGAP